jgi:nitrate/nitrite transport system substrate-binding protein
MFMSALDPKTMRQHRHLNAATCPTCAEGARAWRCEADVPATDAPSDMADLVRGAALRAVFGGSPARRAVLRSLGTAAALALLDTVMPLGTLQAMAEDTAKPERSELTIGFIEITCATPLCLADHLGLFRENGLDVELVRTPSWAVIGKRLLSGDYEASHVLTPQPLSMTLGLRGPAQPTALSLVQNTNGDSITLALKHKEKRDPASWKGMTFAVPFEISMQNLLLRYYLAEHGIDPDRDVSIKPVPPPEMVANMKAGILDGFLAPDNAAQLAVHSGAGFIHLLSKDIWDGHPCCGIGMQPALIKDAPNTCLALTRALLTASAHASKAENRKEVAGIVAEQKYINCPREVAEAVLTGEFEDGLGNHRSVPNRIDFRPFPYHSMAVWMLTQMKRWGFVQGDIAYKDIAEEVFRADAVRDLVKEAGFEVPTSTYGQHVIMGKTFNADHAASYLDGFAIKRG